MKLLLLSALAVAMAQDFEDFASETRDVTHFVKNMYNFLRHGAMEGTMVQLLTPPTGVDWILQNTFFFSGGRSFGGC
jgi:hypothetical protein